MALASTMQHSTIQCILYNVYYTMYTIQCILYSVQYTYTLLYINYSSMNIGLAVTWRSADRSPDRNRNLLGGKQKRPAAAFVINSATAG
jgi:hypothetical protein